MPIIEESTRFQLKIGVDIHKTLGLTASRDLSRILGGEPFRTILDQHRAVMLTQNDLTRMVPTFGSNLKNVLADVTRLTVGLSDVRHQLATIPPSMKAISRMTRNHQWMMEQAQIASRLRVTEIGGMFSAVEAVAKQRAFVTESILPQITPLTESIRILKERNIFNVMRSFQTTPSISLFTAMKRFPTAEAPWYARPGMYVEEAALRPDDDEKDVPDKPLQRWEQTQAAVDFIDDIIDRVARAASAIELGTLLAVVSLVLTVYFQSENAEADLEMEKRAVEREIAFEERLVQRIDDNAAEAAKRDVKITRQLEALAAAAEKKASEQRLYETTFYVVKDRVAVMHCDPADAEPYETWLLPGQIVELIERDSKWIRVIAYDTETSATHVGWVRKKYLKMRQLEDPTP